MPAIEPEDTGARPKVSVVLGVRNEWPCVMWTMLSFVEEFEYWGYPWEVLVVDNMSTDNTADILEDKYRRWVREKLLKVIRYNDRAANVTVRNVGARAATGDVVFLADGHLSIATGTCHGMIQQWLKRGGLWHSAIHITGDTRDIRCYGYDLKLRERFWGNLCRGIPDEATQNGKQVPYRVPMASHCCLMAGREEYVDFRGYCENFRCYGGGEPYLDLKWWLFGKEVWIYPEGLIRHGFGVNAIWRKVGAGQMTEDDKEQVTTYFKMEDEKKAARLLRKLPPPVREQAQELRGQDKSPSEKVATLAANWPRRFRNRVHTRHSGQTQWVPEGEEHLHYSRGYAWNNDQFQFNFMLSAYTIGGYGWLQQRYRMYFDNRRGNSRYIKVIKQLRHEVLEAGAADRAFIASRQVMSLDELLEKEPWKRFDDL